MGAKIILNGNLGDDPKHGKTGEGTPYVQFSLYQAHWTRTGGKNQDGSDEFKDTGGFWMQVAWFSRKADKAAELLKKGTAVIVSGDLRVDYWADRDTGEQKAGYKVVADEVSLDIKGLESVQMRQRAHHSVQPQVRGGNRDDGTRQAGGSHAYAAAKAGDLDVSDMPEPPPLAAYDDSMPF